MSPQSLAERLDDWKRASKHPHIAPFYGVMDGPEMTCLPSLVSPLFDTNLNDHLSCNPGVNPIPILVKVADAVAYMHSLDPPVVHRSIRGRNIVIDNNGEPQLNNCCLEFLPQLQGVSEDNSSFECVRWCAPEVLTPDDELSSEWDVSTPKSDVYSFGMTILE
ncbi:hypothetical protein C0991_010783, partial [Blastosporella zonata]